MSPETHHVKSNTGLDHKSPTSHDISAKEDILLIKALNHPLTKELLQKSTVKVSRSVLAVREEHIANNLTHTTLGQPGMMSSDPFVINDDESGCLVAFYYLGDRLAGHAGIVHGGISAVILDECMGRATFSLLAGRIAVTAKLELQYKMPIKTDSFVVVRASTTKVEGRKAWVSATLEDVTDGQIMVEATGFFIEPKWAASMAQVFPQSKS